MVRSPNDRVILGCENLLEHHLDVLEGRRAGLVTNQTGVDSRLQSLIDLFYNNPSIDLVALYGPEHGIKGKAQAGEPIPFGREKKYGIPVFSLYRQSLHPGPAAPEDMDARMRSFDTVDEGKVPENMVLENMDVMVFDIQDVGCRVYTYVATMAYCMRSCAEKDIDFIVLDRPNPINGEDMEGPVLEYPDFSSFVGLYPIPVRHGMTVGELARLFNERFLRKKIRLTVIPMKGWRRSMWYDQISLPWVSPSPNMPTLRTATVYPGQVFLEGTNISEGRGTTKPFELFGAPWIEAKSLTDSLNSLGLQGVEFRESWFKPVISKYREETCGGCQIHITDRDVFKPFECTLYIIKTIRDEYPEHFEFYEEYFDKIMGTNKIRKALIEGASVKEITDSYYKELSSFKEKRKKYLLYSP